MTEIVIPERHKMLMALKPYFEDQDVLFNLDDDDLISAYCELKFYQYDPSLFEEI